MLKARSLAAFDSGTTRNTSIVFARIANLAMRHDGEPSLPRRRPARSHNGRAKGAVKHKSVIWSSSVGARARFIVWVVLVHPGYFTKCIKNIVIHSSVYINERKEIQN